ncbi:MAG: hypothetical protein ACRDFX_08355, partial [Chloroflexota bacterium]
VAGALIFGTVKIVHGSSPKAPARKHVAMVCVRKHGSHHRTCHALSKRALKHRQYLAWRAYRAHILDSYARGLRPVLARSRPLFDRVAAATTSSSLSGLAQVCNSYGSMVSIAEYQADGVPHSGYWYQPVPRLHHRLFGIYHDMLGAMQDCQTAASNQDSYSASVAQQDAQAADLAMRTISDDVWSLSRKR